MAANLDPAGKLLRFLEALKSLDDGQHTYQALCAGLNVSVSDPILAYKRLARMITLIDHAREQVSKFPDAGIYLNWLPAVLDALKVLPQCPSIGQFKSRIDNTTMERMRYCSDFLSRNFPQQDVRQEELNDIAKQTRELLDEIKDGGLDPRLREFIQLNLGAILDAIEEYHLFGPERLDEALRAVAGTMPWFQDEAKKAPRKFWIIVQHVATVAQTGAAFVSIAVEALKLLPGH